MVKNFGKTKEDNDFFFHLRPVSEFQLNIFGNSKQIMTTSLKKPYKLSDFAAKNPLFSMIC